MRLDETAMELNKKWMDAVEAKDWSASKEAMSAFKHYLDKMYTNRPYDPIVDEAKDGFVKEKEAY